MLTGNSSTHVLIDGKEFLYFGGTNYLSLAQSAKVKAAFDAAINKYGLSSGASRLTSGETEPLVQLEDDLRSFFSAQAALVLPAGFLSNQVAVEAIEEDVDAFVVSPNAHASIQSAVKFSNKQAVVDSTVFGGDQSESLRKRLGLPASMRLAFFAEPIEPMSGRVLDLANILSELQPDDWLILDESHSLGVLGKHGGGALEHYSQLPYAHLIRTGTFSKALGTYGGLLLADSAVVQKAKERSAVFKASTSLPPAMCAATRQSLEQIRQNNFALMAVLRDNIEYMTALAQKLNLAGFANDGVPIFSLPYCPAVVKAREALPSRSIYIPSTSSYFAGYCEVGLRFTIQAGHSRADCEHLASVIAACLTA